MTILPPDAPAARYGPAVPRGNPFTVTAEAGGFVVTCICKWLRFRWNRADIEADQREHAKKCKGEPEKPAEAAPRAARSVHWGDREGATWIDKL